MEPDLDLLRQALGGAPRSWGPVSAGGYTRSRAWRVETASGPVFAKEAEDAGSLHMLRTEAIVYRGVSGPFLPAFVGFADDGERALLAIELLHDAHWPPPYPDDVTPLVTAVHEIARAEPPAGLRAARPWESRWEQVASEPGSFLGLGLCSREWLESAVPALAAAEREADFEGDHLVHNDVYAANVAFVDGRAILIDWGAAVRGSRWIDLALALLSVHVEGGAPPPTPREVVPFVAAFAGHFAVEAPAPLPEWADPGSTLRADMKDDLAVALRWLVELLDLPPLS